MADLFEGVWLCQFQFNKLTKIDNGQDTDEQVDVAAKLKMSVLYDDTDETFYEVEVGDQDTKLIDLSKLVDDKGG